MVDESKELRTVIERIEAKLEKLEEERDAIKHKVELKRAQVEGLENALDNLKELESSLRAAGS